MSGLPAVLHPIVVGTLAYLALIVVLRVSGKRTLTKWNAFDFVVTVALGSVLAATVTSGQVGLLGGVAALVVLIALQFAITWSAVRSPLLRRWVKSRPRLLLRNGQFDEAAMRDERVTHGEVLAAIRSAGIGDVERVGVVVLETDGSVSVIEDPGGMSALKDVVGIDGERDAGPPPRRGRA